VKTYVLARNPTDSVTHGFLPAASRLGLDVTVLTDEPAAHLEMYAGETEVLGCDVADVSGLVDRIAASAAPAAVFSNSDHLQAQAALVASYFDLPGKDWRAALRCRNKALMRSHLAAAGLDAVTSVQLLPADDPAALDLDYPCVLKPREGVASEDVVLVRDAAELVVRVGEIRARRTGALVVEEFLDGPLHTLETVGDGTGVRVLGGFRTELSAPPHFVEERLVWHPDLPEPAVRSVLEQLAALGVGLGACHTEFVVQGGRARLIEVNDRIIGDQCDLLLADVLGECVFELVLRTHLGEALAPSPTPTKRAARVEYLCAARPGVLRQAPPAQDVHGPVRLAYRPLRKVGATVALAHSNRDYLGVLRAVGDEQAQVDAAVDGFLGAHRWEVGA